MNTNALIAWLLSFVALPFTLVWRIFKFTKRVLAFALEPVTNVLSPLLPSAVSGTRLGAMFLHYKEKFGPQGALLDHIAERANEYALHRSVNANDRMLIAGKRQEYAEVVLPKSKYPLCYIDVPEDLRRSIIEDGRLLNGEPPASGLAGLALTPEFVVRAHDNASDHAWKAAVKAFAGFVLISIAVAIVGGFINVGVGSMSTMDFEQRFSNSEGSRNARSNPFANSDSGRSQSSQPDAHSLAQNYEDIWSPTQAAALTEKINAGISTDTVSPWVQKMKLGSSSLVQAIVMFAFLLVASFLFAYARGRLLFIALFRSRVFRGADKAVAQLRTAKREALQKWNYRLDDRIAYNDKRTEQVLFIKNVDHSPLINICCASGNFNFKGHLRGPRRGTQIAYSIVDMLGHTVVLGNTGSGKTRDFLIPVARQLLTYRKQGYPVSLYCTDDKGQVVLDILKICKDLDMPEDDVIVVGTGPNDSRVDMLDGVEPVDLMEVMASVAVQTGGKSSDSFWPDMANEVILHVSTCLRALEPTTYGAKWMAKNEYRMYSLLNILRVATKNEEIELMLQHLTEALLDYEEYPLMQKYDTLGLRLAMEYLAMEFLSIADVTQSGIVANVRSALRKFALREDLVAGFGNGRSDKIISASNLNSNKIRIINVSQSVYGQAGRAICVMLKNMFFGQARSAQALDPEFAEERKNWWFKPQPQQVDNGKYFLSIFIADEYQTLLSADPSSSTGDDKVWGVLRSAGVGAVVLSQSWTSFALAIGLDACSVVKDNWTTKIFLATQNKDTLKECIEMAGRTQRYTVSEWGQSEGTVAAAMASGINCEENQVEWTSEMDGANTNDDHFYSVPKLSEFEFAGYEETYKADHEFEFGLPQQETSDSRNALLGSQQTIKWRAEDKNLAAMQQGSSFEDVLTMSSMGTMGRQHCYVQLQRGGAVVEDIGKLNSMTP